MAIDEEEQKEILLGNKQLLSIFFIVVVLLGVSFTVGYVIGKNTATMHAAEPVRPVPTQASTQTSNQADTPPAHSSPAAAESMIKRDVDPPAVATSTHQAKPYEPDSVPQTPAPAAPAPAREIPSADTPAAGGSYLQVGALKREDADNIAKLLRSRGYPTVLGESSKEGLFRVLVGPFKNMTELAESKQKLRASGMDSFIVK